MSSTKHACEDFYMNGLEAIKHLTGQARIDATYGLQIVRKALGDVPEDDELPIPIQDEI